MPAEVFNELPFKSFLPLERHGEYAQNFSSRNRGFSVSDQPTITAEQAKEPVNPLGELLNKWLAQHNATLAVAIQTPAGELIRPDNFVPAGWIAVPIVTEKK
jgi:hypothetical protein